MWSWGLAAATGLGKGRWISCTSGESLHGRTASYLTPSGFEVQVCCHKHLDGCYRICSCFLPVGLKDESIWSSGLPSTASQTWGSFHKKMSTVDFCGSVETLKVGTHAELQQERCFSTNLLASLARLLSKRGFGPFSCTNLIDIVN